MTEISSELHETGPISPELSKLISDADKYSKIFGGQDYCNGISDMAGASYTAGVPGDPNTSAKITFSAERFRDEPGDPINTADYELSLQVARHVAIVDLPVEVCILAQEVIDELNAKGTFVFAQLMTEWSFTFDSDGMFGTEHTSFYSINGYEFDVEEDGEAGLLWVPDEWSGDDEDDEDYELLSEGDTTEISVDDLNRSLGIVATAYADDAEMLGDTIDPRDFMFQQVIGDSDGFQTQDILLARSLLLALRRRHIPKDMRDALGITVYHPPHNGQ